ncbi:hypothetical protein K8I28_02115 [bacterium]|nr:hypothetical protein [bacterium]
MQNRRLEVLSSLLLLVIAVIVAIGFFQWWRVTETIDRIHAEDRKMVIGTDEKLAQTVKDLEKTLKERIEYQFDVAIDPMDLTRVITSKKLLEKMGVDEVEASKKDMRLAATVIGSDGIATIVIRYMGSNHILRVGDQLAGYTVKEIGRRNAILVGHGMRKELVNEKAPENRGNEQEGVLSIDPLAAFNSSGTPQSSGNY